jgi:hypothetical protein
VVGGREDELSLELSESDQPFKARGAHDGG